MSPLYNVTKVGDYFLGNCRRSQNIKIIPHQKTILFKYYQILKLESDDEWYNTPKGQKWVRKNIEQSNNIQDSDILLNILDYI